MPFVQLYRFPGMLMDGHFLSRQMQKCSLIRWMHESQSRHHTMDFYPNIGVKLLALAFENNSNISIRGYDDVLVLLMWFTFIQIKESNSSCCWQVRWLLPLSPFHFWHRIWNNAQGKQYTHLCFQLYVLIVYIPILWLEIMITVPWMSWM